MQEELTKTYEKSRTFERKMKEFENESKKLKMQVIKLKLRKGRNENLNKICKNCSKEY